jgi:spore coat protein CotH
MARNRIQLILITVALFAGPLWQAVPQSQEADAAAALFDDTVLHDIRLSISTRDWESLKEHFGDNTRYPADLRWRDQVVRSVAIRSRGNGSRSGTKPGLKIDVNYYSTDKRFLGLKNLILRNNTQDPSNMHEILSMALFRRMGVTAPRESFARLFINDQYAGLYTIVETVDKLFVETNFNENDPYIYEYDFEEQQAVPYVFEYRGSDPSLYVPSPFKPETHESNPRSDVIERFIWTMNESGDAGWRTRMDEYVDLPRLVRHLGIENFLAEQDGLTGDWGPNNFYVYRSESNNRFVVVPWDKSNTFAGTPDYWVLRNINDGQVNHRNRLVVRALSYADLMNGYLDALVEAAESAARVDEDAAAGGETRGWLEREISRYYDLVGDAARGDSFKPYTNDDFEQSIANLVAFAKERGAAIRKMVDDLRPR